VAKKKKLRYSRVLKEYISSSKSILFTGDNYSEDWAKEAAKRKLSNIKNTPQALELWQTAKAKEALVKSGMFTERELDARYEIFHENYVKHIQIEGRLLGELAMDYVVPAAIDYQNKLLENVNGSEKIWALRKRTTVHRKVYSMISASILPLSLIK
jgi:glutamine synthetase